MEKYQKLRQKQSINQECLEKTGENLEILNYLNCFWDQLQMVKRDGMSGYEVNAQIRMANLGILVF
jgi:hypothetical protein